MTLPVTVARAVESALEDHTGKPARIEAAAAVGGGCINPSARIITDSGDTFFLKWNPSAPPEMFEAEVDGLQALRYPGTLRVPEVLGTGGSGTAEAPAWLLLEFIPQGRLRPTMGRRLGQGLAALHAAGPGEKTDGPNQTFGWHRDNFIGSLPQENDPRSDWVTFWRDLRLEPQLRMARDRGHFTGGGGRVLDDLLTRLDEVLAGAARRAPALLHGDLWSGNFYPGPSGRPGPHRSRRLPGSR